MADLIEWKCLGDEYLLIRGAQRKVVSSETWWASIHGASPTVEELELLWRIGLVQQEQDSTEKRLASHLALLEELRRYIAEEEQELETARAAAASGTLPREEVRRHEELLESVREQLRAVEREARSMMS